MSFPRPFRDLDSAGWLVARASRAALAGALVLAAIPCLAQEPPPLTGTVEAEGFTPVRIAVPMADAAPGAEEVGEELTRTLRDDLTFSGYFDVVDPSLYSLIQKGKPGSVVHDDWLALGAPILVLMEVAPRDLRLDLKAWVYDNESGELIFARRYGGPGSLRRRIAHQLADDLVRQFTGRPGIALTRIAFVSRRGEGKEIYLMDYDGHRVRRLTTTGSLNLSPVWSPDGSRLAFVSWRTGKPDVFVLDQEGNLDTLPVLDAEMNAAPEWSPDGRALVYSSDASGDPEIYRLDLGTGRHTRLTFSPAIDTAPAYAPTGREIAFTSDRSGSPQIYLMDAEGLNVRRVSFDSDYSDSAAWSPRGDRLAYVSRIEGTFHIVVLDLATGTRRRLTEGPFHHENPRWSPDGRHLVFASNRTGTYQIYTIRSDGRGLRRLTRGENSVTPDWSP